MDIKEDLDNSLSGGKRPHDEQDGGMYGAKRQRSSSNNDRGDAVEVRILIPTNTAGAIIGKSGANIKDLRAEFHTNVQIPDSDGYERVIAATVQDLDEATRFVTKIAQSLNERMRSEDEECSIRLMVHKSQAGTIIGKKGSRIKELRELTGAKIKVNQECCPGSTDRVCQITGTVDVIAKCTRTVLEGLQLAPPRGEIQFYDPSFFDDSYDYGGFNSFDRDCPFDHPPRPRMRDGGFNRGGRGGPRRGGPGRFDNGGYGGGGDFGGPRRGGMGGRGGFGGGYGGGYGGGRGGYEDGYGYDDNSWNNDGYGNGGGYGGDDGYGDFGGGAAQGGFNDDEVPNDGVARTTQVTIPTSLAGSIIGKGGQRIRQIRMDSGATIKIEEQQPGSEERIISITGTPEQTQNAQFLLQKSVKTYSGQRF